MAIVFAAVAISFAAMAIVSAFSRVFPVAVVRRLSESSSGESLANGRPG